MSCTRFLAVICAVALGSLASAQEEPKGPFARGQKIPGDLTDILDGDKSGQVSDAEVNAAIEQFKKEANAPDKTERGKKILDTLDNNRDGKLDQAEAARGAAAARVQQGGRSTEAVTKIFRRLDTDANGFVTANEYAKLKQLVGLFNPDGANKLDDLFLALDADRDTAISFVESQLAADMFAQNGGFQRGGAGPPVAQQPVRNAKIQAFVDATFAKRDRNKDGHISAAEARRDAALKRDFSSADASGDAKLTPEELYSYLERKFAQ